MAIEGRGHGFRDSGRHDDRLDSRRHTCLGGRLDDFLDGRGDDCLYGRRDYILDGCRDDRLDCSLGRLSRL